MDWKNILVLVSFILNTLLGLMFYFRAPKKKAYLAFTVTILGIVGWCLTMFLYRISSAGSALYWGRLLYFFPTIIPAGFVIFGLYFPDEKVSKKLVAFIVGLNVLMATLCLAPGAVVRNVVVPSVGEKIIQFGWAYYFLYIFYIPLLFGFSYWVLFRKYRKGSPLVRQQILYILLGLTGASGIGMTTNLVLPTFGNFEYNWLGQVFLFIWVGCASYAIIKHRLVNIRLVVARAVSYVLLLFSLTVFYVFALFSLGTVFYGRVVGRGEIVVNVLLTVTIAFTVYPLRKYLEKITDKIFFKDRYDMEDLLSGLSRSLSSTLVLGELCGNLLKGLLTGMKIDKGVMVILKEGKIVEVYGRGREFSEELIRKVLKGRVEYLLGSSGQPLVYDELAEGRRKRLLEELGYYVSQKLQVKDRVMGVLLLGMKLSGDIYSSRDIEVVDIVAPQASVAIENAFSYEEIRRFSETLKLEVKKATTDLSRTNRKLREVSALKDEFVSLASHELRTPMTAIGGSISTILDGYTGKITQKSREFLEAAYNENARLIRLVNNLLNISRIEAGRLKYDYSEFDLVLIIKEVMENLLSQAKEKGLVLKSKVGKGSVLVRADKDKVREILVNLVGNGIKYTKKGTVTVGLSEKKGKVVCEVADTGIGMGKEEIKKLFKKFSRLDGSRMEAGGTGLGLYICRVLVTGMKEKIWVESTKEKGSRFFFSMRKAKGI